MANQGEPLSSPRPTVALRPRGLSRDEELALWQQWHENHDEQARDTLVRDNLRYVRIMARKYLRYGMPFDELVAEGNFGVAHAMTKFEPKRGNRFVTYSAYWIRAMMLDYIIHSWSLVGTRSKAFRSRVFFRLRREKARIANLVGEGELAEEMLAARFNTSRDQIAEMTTRLEQRDVSLDMEAWPHSAVHRIDLQESPEANPEEIYERNQRARNIRPIIRAALDTLDLRERHIVEQHLMTSDVQTLADLGRHFGISRQRAQQIEECAKLKLRQHFLESWTTAELRELPNISAA